jgi:MFS family permease
LVFLGLEFGAEYLVKTVVYSVTDTSSLPFITALSAGVGQLTAILIGVWIGAYIGLGKEIRQSHSFVWWIVNRLLFFTAVVGIYSFLLYFVKDMFNLTTNEAAGVSSILSADVGAFLIVAALLSGIISDRIGRKGLLMLAGVLAAAALLLMVMLPSYVMLFISGALLGVAVGIFNTVNWALGTDLVPSDQAARYLGISNLAGAGAGMIASGIGGSLIDYVNLKLPGSTAGYLAIFASFAALCVVSSVVLLAIHEPARQTVMKKVAV